MTTDTTLDAPKETKHAFQLRGSLFTLTVMQLAETALEKITAQLKDVIEKAPKFFHKAPVVLDLQHLTPNASVDFKSLMAIMVEQNLIPIGVRGGSDLQKKAASDAGLALLSISKTEVPPPPSTKKSKTSSPKTIEKPNPSQAQNPNASHSNGNPAVIVTAPVRSGQQIYAKGSDLIVLSTVSPGAEILADGNIHVYGTLKGRALAGIEGNENARIFCQDLQAELVSIAGLYLVNESMPHQLPKTHLQIYLKDQRLFIAPIHT